MPGGHTGHTGNQNHVVGNQTQGVQQLLAAEKKAAEKVAEARKRKAKRIKQAKEEAEVEIEKYRAERQILYEDYEARYLGTKDDIAAQIEKDTDNYIVGMGKMVGMNRNKVIDELNELVINIHPKPHPNFFVLKAFHEI